ncbi:hypothetical protein BpHYR1_006378 [Brachionus plicatilis]|uniref:Uncharacterized protein n=1 Tax=Brachionus plicatilis TaxID=10195 RepID=A0A3M7R6P4_BRAPC|nr:hypothetical protein BpHYR1_006378 [Brachionus plicatilis]
MPEFRSMRKKTHLGSLQEIDTLFNRPKVKSPPKSLYMHCIPTNAIAIMASSESISLSLVLSFGTSDLMDKLANIRKKK